MGGAKGLLEVKRAFAALLEWEAVAIIKGLIIAGDDLFNRVCGTS